jgi:hypothetical protein
MPRKKKEISEKEKEQEKARKRQHKLNSLKTDFEAGKIKSFEQIFAIIAEYQLAKELGLGFTTLRNKVNSAGEFTLNNIRRFAEVVNVEEETITKFLRDMMKPTTKKRSK